jgi:hypothetical protein
VFADLFFLLNVLPRFWHLRWSKGGGVEAGYCITDLILWRLLPKAPDAAHGDSQKQHHVILTAAEWSGI